MCRIIHDHIRVVRYITSQSPSLVQATDLEPSTGHARLEIQNYSAPVHNTPSTYVNPDIPREHRVSSQRRTKNRNRTHRLPTLQLHPPTLNKSAHAANIATSSAIPNVTSASALVFLLAPPFCTLTLGILLPLPPLKELRVVASEAILAPWNKSSSPVGSEGGKNRCGCIHS